MSVGKLASVFALGLFSATTIISGLWFTSYSIATKNFLIVFGNKIPGFLFGMAVVYIGVRSIIKTYRIANRLKQSDAAFSWHNFARK